MPLKHEIVLKVPALDPIKKQLNQFHNLTPFYLRSITCGSLPFSFSTWNSMELLISDMGG